MWPDDGFAMITWHFTVNVMFRKLITKFVSLTELAMAWMTLENPTASFSSNTTINPRRHPDEKSERQQEDELMQDIRGRWHWPRETPSACLAEPQLAGEWNGASGICFLEHFWVSCPELRSCHSSNPSVRLLTLHLAWPLGLPAGF